jgi:hypothetical protein
MIQGEGIRLWHKSLETRDEEDPDQIVWRREEKMSRKSLVYWLIGVGLLLGLVIWMHMGGGGALRSWMMAIHGKH